MSSWSKERIIFILTTAANSHGINPLLVIAQAKIESSLNTFATRYESHWKWHTKIDYWARNSATTSDTERIHQMTSWGLLQVMGAVARELDYSDPLPTLCIPQNGARIGCKKLKLLINKYKELPLALAAYNAGSPTSAAGKLYADKVLKAMDETD